MWSSRWALDEDGKGKARPAGVLIVVVGVEVRGTSRRGACWRFCQQHECLQCLESQLPRRVPRAVIGEKERRRPDHSARTHPAPPRRASEDLRRRMMLRARRGPAAPARFGRTTVDGPRCLRHDRRGVLTFVSALTSPRRRRRTLASPVSARPGPTWAGSTCGHVRGIRLRYREREQEWPTESRTNRTAV